MFSVCLFMCWYCWSVLTRISAPPSSPSDEISQQPWTAEQRDGIYTHSDTRGAPLETRSRWREAHLLRTNMSAWFSYRERRCMKRRSKSIEEERSPVLYDACYRFSVAGWQSVMSSNLFLTGKEFKWNSHHSGGNTCAQWLQSLQLGLLAQHQTHLRGLFLCCTLLLNANSWSCLTACKPGLWEVTP